MFGIRLFLRYAQIMYSRVFKIVLGMCKPKFKLIGWGPAHLKITERATGRARDDFSFAAIENESQKNIGLLFLAFSYNN